MPGFGGYSYFPRRCGGGKPRVQTIHEGLNAQRGTAYSKEQTAVVSLENHAVAREIDAAWGTAQRLANQSNPARMTDMLPRWERILTIPADPEATDPERRAEVEARLARIGQDVNHAHVYSEALRVLGDFFVAVEYISLSLAVITVPDGTYPFGSVVAGAPWSSTVAHVLVRMVIPSGHLDTEYWALLGKLRTTLDAILPVYVTFAGYRAPVVGTPINVAGGPSAGGWYLDEPNLDILVFSS